MPRMVDAKCRICDYAIYDQFMQSPPDVLYHDAGGGVQHPMEYLYLPRTRPAEWDDRQAVVVYQKPNGEYVFPGRNDQPTPKGCERLTLRSLRAVEAFEKKAGVRSEIAWYDRGSGRSAEDDVPRRQLSEEKRFEAFMKGWR